MRIPHVVVDLARLPGDPPPSAGTVALDPADARHLRTVLRLRDGAVLSLTDGAGCVADAILVPDGADVTLWRTEPPPPEVTVHPAVSKGAKLDLVVEKATELGVRRIVPVLSERSERRWDADQRAVRSARWTAVARAALAQSRGAWLPAVTEPTTLPELLDDADPGLLLHPGGARVDWGTACAARVAVGPEGGFTDNEVSAARAAGWHVGTLGARVLRTETAAVVAAALAVAARGGLDP
jgi:16S rRNA (uracil1498-N3)-methyltransferase